MTTIVYRDGMMAADTGMTMGGSTLGRTVKIVRNTAGDLAGACGEAGWCTKFLAWFKEGEQGPYPTIAVEDKQDNGRGLIARAGGAIILFESPGSFEVSAPYFAIGSGRTEALGAMWAGATADDAVRAAIALDNGTFGDVTILEHRPALRLAGGGA